MHGKHKGSLSPLPLAGEGGAWPTSFPAGTRRVRGLTDSASPSVAFAGTRTLLYLMLFAAPLAFGAVQTVAWTSLSILTSILLLIWVFESLQTGRIRIAWSPFYVLAFAFILLGFLQMLTGRTMDSEGAREALLKLVSDCIVFFVALQLWTVKGSDAAPRRRSHGWRALGLTVSVYTFLLALFAILQFFSSKGLIYWHVKTDGWIFGPYVNHNHYAGLMEMLIPVSIAYAISEKRRGGSGALVVFATVLAIVSVLLCGSRGGWIALLLELTALATVVVWRQPRRERTRYLAAGLLATLGLAVLAVWLGGSKITNRLSSMNGLARSSDVALGNRLLVAHDALRMFRDHLWLGTGMGSFAVVYPGYQSFATDAVYHHAHDDYMEAIAETGIIGAGLIFLAIFLFFSDALGDLRARLLTRAGWTQFGAAIGCCGILIHSFADFNLHIPANALWFAFLLGVSQAGRP
jgi:O-antigen ligase